MTTVSLESLMEEQNCFLNQFDEISRGSIIVCFLISLAKAGLNLPPNLYTFKEPRNRGIDSWVP
jgi:hypothetical protein